MALTPEKESRLERMRIVSIWVVLALIVATVGLDLVLITARSAHLVDDGPSIDLGVFVTEATLLATLTGVGSLVKIVGTK